MVPSLLGRKLVSIAGFANWQRCWLIAYFCCRCFADIWGFGPGQMGDGLWDSHGAHVQPPQQPGSDRDMMNVCFSQALRCIKCIPAQSRRRCMRGQGRWESDRYQERGYNSHLLHSTSVLSSIVLCKLPQGSLVIRVIDTPVTPAAHSITHLPFMGQNQETGTSSSTRSSSADHASTRGETRTQMGETRGHWAVFYALNKG